MYYAEDHCFMSILYIPLHLLCCFSLLYICCCYFFTDDDNRIMLKPIPGHQDCQNDYINACYIDVSERTS